MEFRLLGPLEVADDDGPRPIGGPKQGTVLGNAYLDNHDLRARSLLWAESLVSRTGEAVRVAVLYGPTVLIVHHVFRPDNSVQMLEVGASIPWNACAWGRRSSRTSTNPIAVG